MRISTLRTVQKLIFSFLFVWWIILAKNISNNYFFDDEFAFLWNDDRPHQSLQDIYGRHRQRLTYARGRQFRRSNNHATRNRKGRLIVSDETATNNNLTVDGDVVMSNVTNHNRPTKASDDLYDDNNDDSSSDDEDDGSSDGDGGNKMRNRTAESKRKPRMWYRNHNNNHHRRRRRRKRKRKRDRERLPLLLPTPVIVMGYPKAGTSSIFAFFARQGYKSQHWYCCRAQSSPQNGATSTLMAECLIDQLNHNRSNQMLQGCGGDDIEVYSEINGPRPGRYHPHNGRNGYLQDDGTIDYDGPGRRIFLPQHFRIGDLHESYPNATWILNWRDPDAWVESVMKWGDDLHNQFLNEYYMQGAISHIPSNVTHVRQLLQRLYVDHHTMVRNFVRKHPSHALIEVNITDDNAGKDLADAFGLNSSAWMNINQNRKPDSGGDWQARRIGPFSGLLWDIVQDYWEDFFMEDTDWLVLAVVVTTIYVGWSLSLRRL